MSPESREPAGHSQRRRPSAAHGDGAACRRGYLRRPPSVRRWRSDRFRARSPLRHRHRWIDDPDEGRPRSDPAALGSRREHCRVRGRGPARRALPLGKVVEHPGRHHRGRRASRAIHARRSTDEVVAANALRARQRVGRSRGIGAAGGHAFDPARRGSRRPKSSTRSSAAAATRPARASDWRTSRSSTTATRPSGG